MSLSELDDNKYAYKQYDYNTDMFTDYPNKIVTSQMDQQSNIGMMPGSSNLLQTYGRLLAELAAFGKPVNAPTPQLFDKSAIDKHREEHLDKLLQNLKDGFKSQEIVRNEQPQLIKETSDEKQLKRAPKSSLLKTLGELALSLIPGFAETYIPATQERMVNQATLDAITMAKEGQKDPNVIFGNLKEMYGEEFIKSNFKSIRDNVFSHLYGLYDIDSKSDELYKRRNEIMKTAYFSNQLVPFPIANAPTVTANDITKKAQELGLKLTSIGNGKFRILAPSLTERDEIVKKFKELTEYANENFVPLPYLAEQFSVDEDLLQELLRIDASKIKTQSVKTGGGQLPKIDVKEFSEMFDLESYKRDNPGVHIEKLAKGYDDFKNRRDTQNARYFVEELNNRLYNYYRKNITDLDKIKMRQTTQDITQALVQALFPGDNQGNDKIKTDNKTPSNSTRKKLQLEE